MSNKIIITVSGTSGAGKTTISEVINDALLAAGIKVDYQDPDNVYRQPKQTSLAVVAMADKGTTASIRQLQLRRASSYD